MSMPRVTTTHPLTIQAIQATKSSFLSLSLPSPPLQNWAFCLCLSCSHWFSTECSHGSPFCSQVPHFQQLHTQALWKNHKTSSKVCQHTPAPLFPHPQLSPFCKSQLTRNPPPPLFLHANLMAIREWIWPLCKSNQGFSGGRWTL